jgi:uncharacterized protein (TIGR02271 family)
MADIPGPVASEVDTDSALTLPVYEEQLRVATRRVDTGRGVRVSKSVAEQPYEFEQALSHQRVEVRRIPVDEVVASGAAPASRYEGDTLIVPVVEEVLVVEKRWRIREEIRITTVANATSHRESGTLRSEQVSVERFGDAPPAPES